MAIFYLQLVASPGGDLSELDRIQDLFPSDSLGLHGKDPSYPVSTAIDVFDAARFVSPSPSSPV